MESFAISVSHIQATLNGGLNRKRELEWMLRLELLRLQDRDLSRQRRFRLVKLGLNNGESEVTGRISCGSDNPQPAQYRSGVPVVGRGTGRCVAGHWVVPFKRRLKHLSRNIRANGWSYLLFRAVEVIRRITDAAVENAPVSRAEVMSVLRRLFPIGALLWRTWEQGTACEFMPWEA